MITSAISKVQSNDNIPLHFCSLHSQEFTYFCLAANCLRALCSECLKDHFAFHDRSPFPQQVESLTQTKVNCKKKIDRMSEILSGRMESFLLENTLFSAQSLLEEGVEKIEEQRLEMVGFINGVFEDLRARYLEAMGEHLEAEGEFTEIFEKIQRFMNKLQYLRVNVELKNPQDILQRICALDFGSILSKFSEDLESLRRLSEREFLSVQRNEPALKEVESAINRFIFISKEQKNAKNTPINVKPFRQDRTPENGDLLHFFVPESKTLLFWTFAESCDFKLNPPKLTKQPELKLDFKIPVFHSSMMTSEGIFLITETAIFRYEEALSTLKLVNSLTHPRTHFTAISDERSVFVIGGRELDSQGCVDKCEKFDLLTTNMKTMARLPVAVSESVCCVFRGKYLYLFGGKTGSQETNNRILRYDIETEVWREIDPILHNFCKEPNSKVSLMGNIQKGLQINSGEVLLFGNGRTYEETRFFLYVYRHRDKTLSILQAEKLGENCETADEFLGSPIVYQGKVVVLARKMNETTPRLHVYESEGNKWLSF